MPEKPNEEGPLADTEVASPRARTTADRSPTVDVARDRSGVVLAAHGERRYQMGDLLGRGGMGEVHVALDEHIGRDVALKLLLEDAEDPRRPRDRFVREARLQGRLEHPGVVPVYDLSVDHAGRPFFVMKRVAGVTFEEVVLRLAAGDSAYEERFPLPRLLSAFLQVCLTVEYAHSRGVVHRDLKLSNIMLGDFGEVYVLDWGIAKVHGGVELLRDPVSATRERASETRVDDVLGTPGYMAPEQITDSAGVDARADVYALGSILFALVTRQRLHASGSRADVTADTLRGVEARPSVRAPHRELAPELDGICARATETDPSRRYPSARALHDDVRAMLDGARNLATRATLAGEQIELARDALRGEADRAEAPADARRRALMHAARALALHPEDEAAGRFMSDLLLAPLHEVPAEVQRELEEERDREVRRQASVGAAMVLLGLAATVALLVWIGVRAWAALALHCVAVSSVALMAWLLSRRRFPPLLGNALVTLLIGVSVGMTSRIAGPLWLAPLFGMTVVAMIGANASLGRWRIAGLGAVLAGVLVPWLLELTGVLAPHYVFADGVLTLRPDMVALHPWRAQAALAMASCGLIVQVFVTLWQFSREDEQRGMQSRLMTWQHRQLAALHASSRPARVPADAASTRPAPSHESDALHLQASGRDTDGETRPWTPRSS